MPAQESPSIVVARFLKANNYNEVRESTEFLRQARRPTHRKTLGQTLSVFLTEAGLPPDAGTLEKGDLTIEKILEEKKVFDLTLRIEKTGLEDGGKWTLPGRIFVPVCRRLSF